MEKYIGFRHLHASLSDKEKAFVCFEVLAALRLNAEEVQSLFGNCKPHRKANGQSNDREDSSTEKKSKDKELKQNESKENGTDRSEEVLYRKNV